MNISINMSHSHKIWINIRLTSNNNWALLVKLIILFGSIWVLNLCTPAFFCWMSDIVACNFHRFTWWMETLSRSLLFNCFVDYAIFATREVGAFRNWIKQIFSFLDRNFLQGRCMVIFTYKSSFFLWESTNFEWLRYIPSFAHFSLFFIF